MREAKARGANVTCEVTPHHLVLSEDDITGAYETFLKVNPPLRTPADRQALIDGVADGTIDAIVTDQRRMRRGRRRANSNSRPSA